MKSRLVLPLLLAVLLGASSAALARDGRRDLAPEDRREIRQQMRDHWRQEQGFRDDDRRGRSMEPDERRRLRDDMREHRGRSDDRGRRGGRRD
ncbi:MAG: hypothetical protein CVU18_07615 [Betaproteobacteria bacterium HGW-Betaproteobacteria-12]|nr:MAG: hypothetical protein CVU18_07615 [Betaproteobacteria bacterium HGW-Betaproteobacteria-12]